MSALEGIKVIDAATLFAGPLMATVLGDFGADVIKLEHPKRGDPVRDHGASKDGHGLWWKQMSRNKKAVSLNLSNERGQDILIKLIKDADVFIENFRPGTLERWNLSPERLHAENPDLIIMRTTGFGQFGPYSSRPGFGTLAEAMSGFAAITGQPDGPPTLPPFGLADGIAGLAGANAILIALMHREKNKGKGQVIDLALIEPIVTLMGAQPIIYDQLGTKQQRHGNRSVNNAPRNTYQTKDNKWLAVSTSAQAIAERVMHLVGHPEVIDEDWFAGGVTRAEHADELDAYVGDWIAERNFDDVVKAFEEAEAAVAPIYDVEDIFNDPQFQALDTITTVDDPDLGKLRMQNVLFRMSDTPGEIKWAGKPRGTDNEEVFSELGIDDDELASLKDEGVI
ncbi:MAG: CaiB/BaiF CoA transferase family protein [Dehalococcoidia bacterium]|mgnify:CR=1 FL=1